MAGFLAFACDRDSRYEEVLRCRDAGWLHKCVHPDWQEVWAPSSPDSFTHFP